MSKTVGKFMTCDCSKYQQSFKKFKFPFLALKSNVCTKNDQCYMFGNIRINVVSHVEVQRNVHRDIFL